MTQRQQAAQDCLKAAKMLYARGMVNAYEGIVSVRVGGALLITPSQVCKEELTEDDLVEVDIESGATVCTKPGRVASSEVKLHLTAYRARPDVMGVAHAHPPFATAFAVAGRPIRTRAYPEMIVLYDHIPLCRYGRPSTDDVNLDVPDVLKSHDAFLLANHGLVAVGPSAIVAAYRLEGVESIAKVLTLCQLHGGEHSLGEEECAALEQIYYSKRGILCDQTQAHGQN